jgi:hypothetical protein
LAQVVGADHRGLINNDQRFRAELEFVVAQQLHGFSDRQSFVSSTFTDGDVDGLTSRGEQQYPATGAAVRSGDQSAHRRGLACPGRRRKRLHQPR